MKNEVLLDILEVSHNKQGYLRLVGKQEALAKEKSELLAMQQLFDSGRYAQDILDNRLSHNRFHKTARIRKI